MECLFSDQSRALIHVFFAERGLARIPENTKAAYDAASRRLAKRFRDEVQCLVADGAAIDAIERALGEFGMRADWVQGASPAGAGADSRDSNVGPGEILERLLYSFVNEGARMLEEGLPALAAHIDVLCIRDCGFPPYRGGPMWQADIRGLQAVYRRICSFHERHGDRWAPAPLLQRLAARGTTLAEYDTR